MAFEDITTNDFVDSENTEEVADLPGEEAEVEGEKESEIAEQTPDEPQDDATNAAFAEMRRAKEAAEKELAELKAQHEEEARNREARESAIASLTGDDEDAIIRAIAETNGMTIEEVEAELEQAQADAEKDLLIESLQNQINEQNELLMEREAEKTLNDDLKEIQSIAPEVKSLADIPEGYEDYRLKAGLSATQSYVAVKMQKEMSEPKPPKEIGRLVPSEPERDYYTEAEVNAMTSEEKSRNWEKIMASLPRWKK